MEPTPDGTTDDSTAPDDKPLDPATVRDQHQALVRDLHERGEDDVDTFRALFTPRTRGALLHILLEVDEPLTAAEICDRYPISRSAFADHIDVLVTAGVVEAAGKRGNAQTYRRNDRHPVTQLLRMAETVQRHGVTPRLLDDAYVGDPGAGVDPETGEP